jgi:hypothetical protein
MDWQTIYRAAVLETDPQKMPERIASAREAINNALIDAHYSTAERETLEDALRALVALENEARNWPKEGRFIRQP